MSTETTTVTTFSAPTQTVLHTITELPYKALTSTQERLTYSTSTKHTHNCLTALSGTARVRRDLHPLTPTQLTFTNTKTIKYD